MKIKDNKPISLLISIALFILLFFITFGVSYIVIFKKIGTNKVNIQTSKAIKSKKIMPKDEAGNDLQGLELEIYNLEKEFKNETVVEKRLEIQKKILEIQEKKLLEREEETKKELKFFYDTVLPTVATAVIKVEGNFLVLGIIVQNENYYDEIWDLLIKTFEDKYKINVIDLSILIREKNLKKIIELTIYREEFMLVKDQKLTTKEKIIQLKNK